MAITRFTQLDVWKRSHAVALSIYQVTKGFPADERYLFVLQMRRAAVSIPSNIAEGFGRRGSKDKAHFYTVSQGSAQELAYHLIRARDLGYVKDVELLEKDLDVIGAMLTRLIDKTLVMGPARFR